MEQQSVDYFSYLLRIWRTGEHSAWRASLEDPQTGERQGFGSLEALWVFLQERAMQVTEQNKKEPSF